LNDSDFPKQYLLVSPVGASYHSRQQAKDLIVRHSEIKYILCLDNDVVVPKTWWEDFKRVFDSNPKVGAIVSSHPGHGPPLSPRFLTSTGITTLSGQEKIWEAGWDPVIRSYTSYVKDGQPVVEDILYDQKRHGNSECFWDGMVILRREFYQLIRPEIGREDYFGLEIMPAGSDWKVMVASGVDIQHDKNVGATGENTVA
jgi:GT2 family glycosyltransferase